jgi:hypothetical protein
LEFSELIVATAILLIFSRKAVPTASRNHQAIKRPKSASFDIPVWRYGEIYGAVNPLRVAC